MPTAKELKKLQKALEEAKTVFEDIDLSSLSEISIETESDKIREAASVIAYFDFKEKFIEETCRFCNKKFVYAYYTTAVKCCSILCMAAHLGSLGLRWDPYAPLERRWGPRGIPAIVPAVAYEIIQQQAPEPETLEPATNSIGAADLIDRLEQLSHDS